MLKEVDSHNNLDVPSMIVTTVRNCDYKKQMTATKSIDSEYHVTFYYGTVELLQYLLAIIRNALGATPNDHAHNRCKDGGSKSKSNRQHI